MVSAAQPEQKKGYIFTIFAKISNRVSDMVGSPYWFFFSIMIVVLWFPLGFFLGFNDIWHLLINTTTTILTFLMMSLLHASQSKWEKKIEAIEKHSQKQINKVLELEKTTEKDLNQPLDTINSLQ